MKSEVRIIGIDDASFDKYNDKKTLVVGTLFRGGSWLDGVMSTVVEVDGDDATAKISEMINKCKFKPQVQCIMLDGIAVAGFNVVDVVRLNKTTKIPVMVVMRDYPELEEIKRVLIKLGKADKVKLLEQAGEIIKAGKIHVQLCGLTNERAAEFLEVSCTHSFIPEPIRVAHLIGAGIVKGESRGRA
ncbi:MAG: DUF99 family protein, partial [Candidatus Woesearchaeota archaeon]